LSFSADREEVTRGARTILLLPDLPPVRTGAGRGDGGGRVRRDRTARAEEAAGLAIAIGLDVVADYAVTVRKAYPATLIGKGQVDILAAMVEDERAELVVADTALTPIQQRNLESAVGAKVIDRTALILEIFGERAATAEGRLQVELAHLDYQQGRLVRSWTHLERQRGGFGFLGGPGETQIEADRRMIRDRMARLRRSLDDVRRTRSLHRVRRQRAPWPVVALVGYTNAGKSTLFHRLSRSAVVAEDMLFATLDPTMRQIEVDGLGKVILSDTVGFVSDLPTQLVAAFRATLEEVQSADLLLHVRDVSHPDSEAQRADVLDVLAELGIGTDAGEGGDDAGEGAPTHHAHDKGHEDAGPRVLEVHNKIDLLTGEAREAALHNAAREGAVAVSAVTGEGVDALMAAITRLLGGDEVERQIVLPDSDGATRAWLHRHARVIDERPQGEGMRLYRIALSAANSARLSKRLAAAGSDGANE
jgi:GTP-binding protein HflX